MPAVRSYKDLVVWERSMELARKVYLASGRLPETERFGLVAQLRRGAVSIPSNIAEGYGRQATGDYRHHLSIARGATLELETQVLLCERLGYLAPADTAVLLGETTQIAKMLAGLIAKLR
jgi:four helix bundle protein